MSTLIGRKWIPFAAALAFGALVWLGGCDNKPSAPAADPPPVAKEAPAPKAEADVTPYPLETCVVSGEKLGEMGKPARLVHEGQEIKFCCGNCIKDFKKDPAKFLAKIREASKKK